MLIDRKELVRNVADKYNVNWFIVDDIFTHQFECIREATRMKDVHSVEISGLGKFLFNEPKAKKRIQQLDEMIGHLENKMHVKSTPVKLESCIKEREELKEKIYGCKSNLGGMEK